MKKYLVIIIVFVALICICIFNSLGYVKERENTENKENLKNIDKVIYSYNNPIIPNGFSKVETKGASWKIENEIPIGWDNGLVIEDGIGNQFVWIPVNIENLNYSDFAKKYYKDYIYDSSKEDKFTEQIKKYGGFYIARYEAGIDETRQNIIKNISEKTNDFIGKPVSKKDVLPWNFISYSNANKSARNMYFTDEINSDLISMEQALIIFEWLNEKNYNVYRDSSAWGNYSNVNFEFDGYYSIDYGKNYFYGKNKKKQTYNMILSTGASERNSANNIYDIAGNLWEYTNTFYEKLGYYCIGGHYDNTGIQFSAGSNNLKNIKPLEKVGFRVVLFLNI